MAFFDGFSSPVSSRFRVPGVVVVAGVMVGSIVTAGIAHEYLTPHRYALHLEACNRPSAIYWSAFEDDTAITDHNPRDGQTLTFTRDFAWIDGCEWKAIETLTPAHGGYRYDYDEKVVACPANRKPALEDRTPRSGFVFAHRLRNDHAALTPSSGHLELREITELADIDLAE